MKDVLNAWWVGEAIKDRETFIFAATAGLGSGKTHGRCFWHWYLSRENKNATFSGELWPTYQKVFDSAIPTYRKVFESLNLKESRDFEVIKSPYPKIRFPTFNGHEILFLSAEHPQRINAVEYSHGSIDEGGIIAKDARDNFIMRVRDTRAKRRQIFDVGAPQGINDFADRYDSDTLPNWNHVDQFDSWSETSFENKKVRKRRFRIWTDHNQENLPPEYIPIMMDTFGHNPNYIRSYRYGDFCPLQMGAAYANYLPQRHDIEDKEADPFRDIILCMDFNAEPLSWTAVQKWPFDFNYQRRFRYIALEEANNGPTQLDESAAEFAAKFPVSEFYDSNILLYGDRSGHAKSHKIRGSDFDLMKKLLEELGYRHVTVMATRQVAPEAASVEAVNALFRNDLLVVCRKCRLLRRSLMATRWKEGVRKLEKPAGETHTHPADGLKYWAWQETRGETGKIIRPQVGDIVLT